MEFDVDKQSWEAREKIVIGMDSETLVGYDVEANGLNMPRTITSAGAIAFTRPESLKEFISFLALVNYFRYHFRN